MEYHLLYVFVLRRNTSNVVNLVLKDNPVVAGVLLPSVGAPLVRCFFYFACMFRGIQSSSIAIW